MAAPANSSQVVVSANAAAPRRSGAGKSRTGCEQCKKRKVKCDERQPTCSRCLARKETCTGNFQWDLFQIERPWVTSSSAVTPVSVLENDLLRYWFDRTCLVMALFRPPVNPLSYSIGGLLRHSKALRHTFESVALAHQESFSQGCLTQALQTRGLAIVSLAREVDNFAAKDQDYFLIRTILLSSLILHISSSWLDPTGSDHGALFLAGIHNLVHRLAEQSPVDEYAFYAIGLFLYCEAFSSHVGAHRPQSCPHKPVLHLLLQPPFTSHVHPVTGLAATICPLIRDAGQMYREAVESRCLDLDRHTTLETRLRDWQPLTSCSHPSQLFDMSDAYKKVGLIMIQQARAVVYGRSSLKQGELLQNVRSVLGTLKHVPSNDPLINWVGPLLVIAGSEVPSMWREERELVLRCANHLFAWIRSPTHHSMINLIKETWKRCDQGTNITWLELMVQGGSALVFG